MKRRFYSYVKVKTKARTGIGPLKDSSGRVFREDTEMAELLNQFFASVFSREDTSNIPESEEKTRRDGLTNVKITRGKVRAKIKQLRSGAAAGPDGIGPQLLKETVDQVAGPLASVMTKSLNEGTVPQDWLVANTNLHEVTQETIVQCRSHRCAVK